MVKLSKPISAGRIVDYHREQFTAADQSAYYAEGGKVVGQFHGRLAEEWNLLDQPATEEIVTRLAEGQHPWTGEQLIKHRTPAACPDWEKRNAAWSARVEGHLLQAIESGGEPFEAAKLPGRPKGPEAIMEPARETKAPSYDERQRALIEIQEKASRFYAELLAGDSGAAGRSYLAGRGVGEEAIAEFRLGFAGDDNDLVEHLAGSYSREMLLESGLVYARKSDGALQDRFRNRVMIPIQDGAGNVVAFSGRRIDGNQDRKYINSAASPIYKKSQTPFNAHRAAAETDGRLVVVEGPLDAIQAHQAGMRKVVALSGTAIDPEAVKRISSHVLLNLDGDEAGRAATEKHIDKLLEAGVDVRALSLADDPDKFIRTKGAEAYRAEVAAAKPLVTWLAARARERFGFGDSMDRAAGYRSIMEHLSHVPESRRQEADEEIRRHLGLRDEQDKKPDHAEHRAGFDMVFSPPKSVSVQALVGGTWNGEEVPGDQRIVESHKRAVQTALDRMEEFVQARYRDARASSSNWVAATFLHDVSRPVAGQTPNPQLHTHAVVFNLTRADEKIRSMDPAWLYRTQSYGNAVYMSEMANDLRKFGYELQRGKHFAYEIRGYSAEYLKAMSQRTTEIEEEKELRGVTGAEASEIAGHRLRQAKQHWEPEALRAEHRRQAAEFGHNPATLEAASRERGGHSLPAAQRAELAREALTYAKERLYHGQAVNEAHELMRDALRYRPDLLRIADVEKAFAERRDEFVEVGHYRAGAPGKRYTTPDMQEIERESIQLALRGQGVTEPIVAGLTRDEFRENYRTRVVDGKDVILSDAQSWMAYRALTSRNQYVIVAGAAGVGKSTSFEAVTEIAEQHRAAGYRVVGMAATSSATNNLRDMGVAATTLQMHNTRGADAAAKRTLYLLDEGSLVGSQSFHKFAKSVRPQDRVIIAYDRRQHHAVEAGRIVEELESAGVETIRLEKIVRQRDNPELLAVIEKFRDSFGHKGSANMIEGLQMLEDQARIWQAPNRNKRFEALAAWYAHDTDGALIVSPDNQSLDEINLAVRAKLQATGAVKPDGYQAVVLKGLRGLTDADKRIAANYEPGNVIRWGKAGTLGGRGRVGAGQYTAVVAVDADKNEVTIRAGDAFGVRDIAFDPRSGQGEIYESEVRQFAVGDRIQITRPWRVTRGDVIANRAIGTITALNEQGEAELDVDGRKLTWNIQEMPHAYYGYAMTSYSAQSLTVSRVAVHIDTGDSRIRPLLEKALLYVGASRGANDVMIFTDDRETLLSAEESPVLCQHDKPMALSNDEVAEVRVA